MKVIEARNVHQALPKGLRLLQRHGIQRDSRNGPVMVIPGPVTTVYEQPCERVLFWPERDANPAFHLYEALWMLAGRRDIAPLVRYAKNMANYSDDGKVLHAAYGYRWRHGQDAALDWDHRRSDDDQLPQIAEALRKNAEDRRCVLQMWESRHDLGHVGKDVPCNLMATFQRDADGRLDLTVFCRSNDIIWGAYGANAVHFSMLQEYMAYLVGCPVGTYHQVSVNWHAYRELFDTLSAALVPRQGFADVAAVEDPYALGLVTALPLLDTPSEECGTPSVIAHLDECIAHVLEMADTDYHAEYAFGSRFFATAALVLRAHQKWRMLSAPERYDEALAVLAKADQTVDWVAAMTQWIRRRQTAWLEQRVGVTV